MIQHLCDRCKAVLDEKIDLVRPAYDPERKGVQYKEFKDGESQWRFTLTIHRTSDLCRNCVCAVIMGWPLVEAALVDGDANAHK